MDGRYTVWLIILVLVTQLNNYLLLKEHVPKGLFFHLLFLFKLDKDFSCRITFIRLCYDNEFFSYYMYIDPELFVVSEYFSTWWYGVKSIYSMSMDIVEPV